MRDAMPRRILKFALYDTGELTIETDRGAFTADTMADLFEKLAAEFRAGGFNLTSERVERIGNDSPDPGKLTRGKGGPCRGRFGRPRDTR
jgi:hypothetical protein